MRSHLRNCFKIVSFIALLGFVSMGFVGCNTMTPELSREKVPQSGRYTIIARDTNKITMMQSGLTVFSNARQRVTAPNQILNNMKTALIKELNKRPHFDYVPNTLKRDYLPPLYHVAYYDGAFSYQDTNETSTQESLLIADMKKLSEENKLNFILVMNEWAASSYPIDGRNLLLHGFGIHFTNLLGLHSISPYMAYQIRLFEPKSGLFSKWTSVNSLRRNQLDNSRWMDISKDVPLTLKEVEPFVKDLEFRSPPSDLNTGLCVLGLLPITAPDSFALTDVGKCKNSYEDSSFLDYFIRP
ncbi:MAG: hypothetical protein WA080_02780 [Sulfuricurvum sp.]